MRDELYTDGVGEITVGGTIVRVDLVSLSPTERDANGAPKSVFKQRLIFSVEGFANSMDLLQKALQGLVDAGAVTRTQPRQPTVTAVKPSSGQPLVALADKPRARNQSPNFLLSRDPAATDEHT